MHTNLKTYIHKVYNWSGFDQENTYFQALFLSSQTLLGQFTSSTLLYLAKALLAT